MTRPDCRELDPVAATDFCFQLGRALEALRLNHQFVPWMKLRSHLHAISVLPPGAFLRIHDESGWPHPNEWLRVQADRRLAGTILPELQSLVSAGDGPSVAKAAYLRAMAQSEVLPVSALDVTLIARESRGARFAVRIDRIDLTRPSFVRWSLRILDLRARQLSPDELCSFASISFQHRLASLSIQSAPELALLLDPDPDIEIDEVVRCEIGPVESGPLGPRMSALVERVGPALDRVIIDDPLVGSVAIPQRMGYARNRKWAVPSPDMPGFRADLARRGSRNIVYGYTP